MHDGLSAADWATIATAALAAIAAGFAGWTAGETRRLALATERTEQRRVLESIHAILGHVTEAGWSENVTTSSKLSWMLRGAPPPGVQFTMGQDLRGKIAAAHCDLPRTHAVADVLIAQKPFRAPPVDQALAEVERELGVPEYRATIQVALSHVLAPVQGLTGSPGIALRRWAPLT